MVRWDKEVRDVLRNAGLIVLSVRCKHHRVYKVMTPDGGVTTVTVSLSPKSIEQAVIRLRQELKRRFHV